ncbi:MAG TPA: hypothetical protein VM557_08145, partial [Thermoanaerobaculia bacterium]|nr:hypothetical protein [Thermoanaerobaculia bacterium]
EGSRVAIVVPMREWERGYAWAYYRASWFLAGREVVPLLDEDDRFLRENLQRADFVASWGGEARLPRFVPLWRGPDGILYGRER